MKIWLAAFYKCVYVKQISCLSLYAARIAMLVWKMLIKSCALESCTVSFLCAAALCILLCVLAADLSASWQTAAGPREFQKQFVQRAEPLGSFCTTEWDPCSMWCNGLIKCLKAEAGHPSSSWNPTVLAPNFLGPGGDQKASLVLLPAIWHLECLHVPACYGCF